MRYLGLLIVVTLFLFVFIANGFAQSSETEALKSKVEMLEQELKEIKDLLKQQIERDAQKEKEIASLKEEVQKKEVKNCRRRSSCSSICQRACCCRGRKSPHCRGIVFSQEVGRII